MSEDRPTRREALHRAFREATNWGVHDGEFDGVSAMPIGTNTAVAECPRCGREEEFEDLTIGMAWLHEHIIAEHGEKLPPVKNDG